MITVVRAGPLTTVQDLGRPGYAHLGVPRSGALDQPALRRANALAGNPPDAAVLETTLMGCVLRFSEAGRVGVAGATATIKVDGQVVDAAKGIEVPAGGVLEIGRATGGVRSYVAIRGGLDVPPVLGSRSTDTLSGLGPPRLTDGMTLPVGTPRAKPAEGEPRGAVPPDSSATRGKSELVLDVVLGPRDDWFRTGELFATAYTVSPVSNRVGTRLAGTALTRNKAGELPSEGVVLGSVQVPADGQPLIFLADHPTTGGYPVIGVVDDVTPLAQARPGTTVRFRALD
nr:biotin-dependent carboxyltransferase family protein [uncultured Actinoplanes sp.]